MTPVPITGDDRPIVAAWSNAPDETGATVGYQGVTRIVPYREPGEMALVPWLAVYKGETLAKRLRCGAMAEIRYVE